MYWEEASCFSGAATAWAASRELRDCTCGGKVEDPCRYADMHGLQAFCCDRTCSPAYAERWPLGGDIGYFTAQDTGFKAPAPILFGGK